MFKKYQLIIKKPRGELYNRATIKGCDSLFEAPIGVVVCCTDWEDLSNFSFTLLSYIDIS